MLVIRSTVAVLSRMNSRIPFRYSRDEAASFPSVIVDDDDVLSCRLLLLGLSPTIEFVERQLPSSSDVVNIRL